MCFGSFIIFGKARRAFSRNKGEFVYLEPGGILARRTIFLDVAFGSVLLSYLKKRPKQMRLKCQPSKTGWPKRGSAKPGLTGGPSFRPTSMNDHNKLKASVEHFLFFQEDSGSNEDEDLSGWVPRSLLRSGGRKVRSMSGRRRRLGGRDSPLSGSHVEFLPFSLSPVPVSLHFHPHLPSPLLSCPICSL